MEDKKFRENLTKAQERIRKLSQFNQRILDNAPVSIMVLDKKGKITSVNEYFKKFTGTHNPLNRSIFNLSFFEREHLVKPYKELLKFGTPFQKHNCQTKNFLGQEKYLSINAVALWNNNKIDGAVSMAVDNTEAVLANKKLEQLNQELAEKVRRRTSELDRINKKLIEALELKSKFIADASHELRTPLTIIQGNLGVAAKYVIHKNEEINDLFKIINQEVELMSGILSDLTMLANADSNQEHPEYERINLSWKIKDALSALKVLAKRRNIKFEYRDRGALEIFGDGAKIIKLLLNILRNAIKYNKENGWVKIWTEKNADYAIVHVADSGIGIPEKDLPYIFERFYRVDKARSRSEGGSGLGLAISKWIVKAHKGKIEVESQLGKGSRFTIYLPFNPENEPG